MVSFGEIMIGRILPLILLAIWIGGPIAKAQPRDPDRELFDKIIVGMSVDDLKRVAGVPRLFWSDGGSKSGILYFGRTPHLDWWRSPSSPTTVRLELVNQKVAAKWFTPDEEFGWAPDSGSADWELFVKRFQAQDVTNRIAPGKILVIGDHTVPVSSIRHDKQRRDVIVRAIGPGRFKDFVWFADRVIVPYLPRKIIICLGDNDVRTRMKTADILFQCRRLVNSIREELPHTQIVLVSILPRPGFPQMRATIKRTNAALREFAESHPETVYLDVIPRFCKLQDEIRDELFQPCGACLNERGNKIYLEELRPHFK